MKNFHIYSFFMSFPSFSFQDQKKFQVEQVSTEHETAFTSRSSPSRPLGPKKVVGPRANGAASNNAAPNRRLSLNSNGSRSMGKDSCKRENRPAAPANVVAISKEDVASHVSGTEPSPVSP